MFLQNVMLFLVKLPKDINVALNLNPRKQKFREEGGW